MLQLIGMLFINKNMKVWVICRSSWGGLTIFLAGGAGHSWPSLILTSGNNHYECFLRVNSWNGIWLIASRRLPFIARSSPGGSTVRTCSTAAWKDGTAVLVLQAIYQQIKTSACNRYRAGPTFAIHRWHGRVIIAFTAPPDPDNSFMSFNTSLAPSASVVPLPAPETRNAYFEQTHKSVVNSFRKTANV